MNKEFNKTAKKLIKDFSGQVLDICKTVQPERYTEFLFDLEMICKRADDLRNKFYQKMEVR